MQMQIDELNLYKKASCSLLFDDLLEFVLLKWPLQIDTNDREYVDYDKFQANIKGLYEICDLNREYFEQFCVGNLLIHLNDALMNAIHKVGIFQNIVSPRTLNKDYIKYLFEKKSIIYAIEQNVENIPAGLRDNLDSLYDKNLIAKYFQANMA